MSFLSTLFRQQAKQTKDITKINEMTYSVSYPTGFLNFDFANGYIQEVNGQRRFEIGLADGSLNMLIGPSSVGKTTFLISSACNITRPFKTACVFFEQAEVGTNLQRIRNLTGYASDEEFMNRFIVRDSGITVESLYDRVKMIHDIKVDHAADFLYDTGMIDMRGERIYKFEPTVVIADSVKMIMNKKTSDDDPNNMTGATTAKSNAEYYTKMIPLCKEANIIMILVNHITTDINTGYTPKKSELPYLAQGEHLPGGKSLTYAMSNIIKLNNKLKLKPEDGFGISGAIVELDIVKSRTNKSGKSRCSLIFDQETGFDSDLSLFLMLKEAKMIEGGGAYLKLPGCEVKFSQRNFKQTLYSNPEFYKVFTSLCYNHLTNILINEYERIKAEESQQSAVVLPYMAILQMMQSQAA